MTPFSLFALLLLPQPPTRVPAPPIGPRQYSMLTDLDARPGCLPQYIHACLQTPEDADGPHNIKTDGTWPEGDER